MPFYGKSHLRGLTNVIIQRLLLNSRLSCLQIKSSKIFKNFLIFVNFNRQIVYDIFNFTSPHGTRMILDLKRQFEFENVESAI